MNRQNNQKPGECKVCKHFGTMGCPNSSRCFAVPNKPFFSPLRLKRHAIKTPFPNLSDISFDEESLEELNDTKDCAEKE